MIRDRLACLARDTKTLHYALTQTIDRNSAKNAGIGVQSISWIDSTPFVCRNPFFSGHNYILLTLQTWLQKR